MRGAHAGAARPGAPLAQPRGGGARRRLRRLCAGGRAAGRRTPCARACASCSCSGSAAPTHAVAGARFFREALAGEIAARPGFAAAFQAAVPLLRLEGVVTHEASGRRAARVLGLRRRRTLLVVPWRRRRRLAAPRRAGERAARRASWAAAPGDALLLRVAQRLGHPGGSLFGRRDDAGPARCGSRSAGRRAARAGRVLAAPAAAVGAGALRAPAACCSAALEREGRSMRVLLRSGRRRSAAAPCRGRRPVREAARPEDLGLRLRRLDARRALSLEGDTGLLDDGRPRRPRARGGDDWASPRTRYLTYLANAHPGSAAASIPYSLVTARRRRGAGRRARRQDALLAGPDRAQRVGGARPRRARPATACRSTISSGTRRAGSRRAPPTFELAGVVPLDAAAPPIRDLTPEYPGITGSAHLSDWDPPVSASTSARVRPQDEDYWDALPHDAEGLRCPRARPGAVAPSAGQSDLAARRSRRATTLEDAASRPARTRWHAPGSARDCGLARRAGPGGRPLASAGRDRLRRVLHATSARSCGRRRCCWRASSSAWASSSACGRWGCCAPSAFRRAVCCCCS